MNEWVSPLDVVLNGSQHLHAIESGLQYSKEPNDNTCPRMMFSSLDAAVVDIGNPNPFPIPLQPSPDVSDGIAFNLYNNIWDTNCIRGISLVVTNTIYCGTHLERRTSIQNFGFL